MGVSVNQNSIYPEFWVVQQPTWEYFNYIPNASSNSCAISKYSGSDIQLIIPEQIHEYTITKIAERAFSNCTNLVNVSIPMAVTQIGDYAFYDCNNLECINIPDGITSIGGNAFRYCSNLSRILFLGNDLPTVGPNCFTGISPTIYCYEYSEVDFWATEMGFDVIYIDDKNLNTPWSLTLPDDCKLAVGHSLDIFANIFPATGPLPIDWSSSAPNIITVEDGCITALAVGEALITAKCGDLTDSVAITAYAELESFDLSASELWVVSKETTHDLYIVNIQPPNATYAIDWTSSDVTVATVDSSGYIVAKVPGDAVVTAISNNGISRSCTIHVCYPVTAIELAENAYSMAIGKEIHLTANVTMGTQNCINRLVTFASSNEGIATVDENGLIRAVGVGSTMITVKSDNGITAICMIEVTDHDHVTVTDAAIDPTCTEDGLTEGTHCSVCNKVFTVQVPVPALGHTEVIDEAVAATCSEVGYSVGKHCSVCQEILIEQIILEKHSTTLIVDTAVAPNCTTAGLTAGKHCSVCGEVLVAQEVVPALGHTEVTDEAVAPTCTETGLTEGMHCDVCGEVLVAQEIVPALGHTPSATQQVYEVNVGSEMYVSFRCLCGHNDASLVKWKSENTDIAMYVGAPDHADPGRITATFAGMSTGVSTVTADFVDEATEDCVFTIIVHSDDQMILPAMLRTVDEEAFMNAPVQEVILPEGMTVIGERAFANCAELVIIHMPDSIESIADDAFAGCEKATFICASENVSAMYAAEHGIPYVIIQ